MPVVGFAVRFGSGTGETFPRADRVKAAQCPLGDWYLLSTPIAVAGSLRRLPTRPKQPGASKGTTTSFTAAAY